SVLPRSQPPDLNKAGSAFPSLVVDEPRLQRRRASCQVDGHRGHKLALLNRDGLFDIADSQSRLSRGQVADYSGWPHTECELVASRRGDIDSPVAVVQRILAYGHLA